MAVGATDVDKFLNDTISLADRARIRTILEGRKISMLRGKADDWCHIFQTANWPQNTAIICDTNTWQAMGEALAPALSNAGFRITLLNLGSAPKADSHHVDYIRTACADTAALIAVGSGTLNDLVKLASFQHGQPYAICATAASMNGYLSANAAIMTGGHKKSVPAHLPQLALFDYGVMQSAPSRLNAAGLGDSICRSTAQVDWLLSHHLLGTTYDSLPFALLKPLEEKLLAGDFEALVQTLLLSGLGMTLAGGSYPASQGEHLLAHYVEMQQSHLAHRHYHGEHIAVTTLLMAEIQARILNDNSTPVISAAKSKGEIMAHFGATGESVWKEYEAKQDAWKQADFKRWPEIRATLLQEIQPTETLRRALEKADAPTRPEQLGWNAALVHNALAYAKTIRNRVTFLDLI